jgi:predicted AlkP superfamily phosphohydrolase/phosphomutase
MKRTKVILIGIDGATWNVITPLISSQKLPTFKKLVENGIHNELESTVPPISPSAWTSIFTGTNPGKHNIFKFVKRKKNSYFIRPISSKDRTATPIWKLLSDNNKRSILLNIPFSYPPDKIKGIMTSGLGTPSKSSNFAYPEKFKDEVLKKFPNYDVDFNEDMILLGADKNPVSHILKITDEQIKLTKHLLKTEHWDFFSVVFRATDVIQHYFWNEPDQILKIYTRMDKILKWILNNIDDDTILMICSDHGFAPVHTKVFMNNWLEYEKYLHMTHEKPKGLKKILPKAETFQRLLLMLGFKKLLWKLKHSTELENILKRFVPSSRAQHLFDRNWELTRAYFMEGSFGMININLKDREPEGIVDREDWDKTSELIIARASELKNPENNEKVIIQGFKGRELYGGSSKDIPDIILVKKTGYTLLGGYNYSGNIFEPENIRVADHDKNGILIMYGSKINKGKVLDRSKVYDISPTILYILNLPTPKNMDGNILNDAFSQDFQKNRIRLLDRSSEKKNKQYNKGLESTVISRSVEKLTRKGKI